MKKVGVLDGGSDVWKWRYLDYNGYNIMYTLF